MIDASGLGWADELDGFRESISEWMYKSVPAKISGLAVKWGGPLWPGPDPKISMENIRTLIAEIWESEPDCLRLMFPALRAWGKDRPIEMYGAVAVMAATLVYISEH